MTQQQTHPDRHGANVRRKLPSPAVIYFFGALGALMWGYDSGVLAGALLFIRPQLHMTPAETGLVASALSVGSAVGAAASGLLANPIGRKKLIFIASVVFAVGTAAMTFAPGVPALIWGRAVLGVGIGLVAVSVPVYLSEISPAGTRGKIGSLTQLMIAVGILLGYIGNLALSPFGAWRIMFAVMIVPTVVLGIGVWVLPESPRWLLRKGHPEEARALLAHQVSREELDRTMAEMQSTLYTRRITLRQMFASGLGKIVVFAIVLDVLTQMMGINTIVYYAPTIMKAMGFSNATALINTVGFGVLSVIFTIFAAYVLDKWGRRPLLIVGAIVMAASMATMATLSFTIGLAVGISGVLGIFALAVFKAMFSLSWGTATRVVIAELLPTKVRAGMQGVAQLFNYAATFAVTLIFPILLATGSGWAFAFFAVMGVVAFVVVLALLPETKGQTLEEIEAKVTGAVPAVE